MKEENKNLLVGLTTILVVFLIGIWIGILFGSFIEINHYGDIYFPND